MAISLDNPVPLSKLDAVNVVLRARGRGPTAALGEAARPQAREAEDTLATALLEVLSGDWHFNKQENLKLTPDGSNEIVLPNNLLSFAPTSYSLGRSLSQIGTRLFDMDEATFKFTGPIFLEATFGYAFEDVPQPIRWYVALQAAFQFANQQTPGDASMRPSAEQLAVAHANARAFDARLRPRNLRVNPHFRRLRRNR